MPATTAAMSQTHVDGTWWDVFVFQSFFFHSVFFHSCWGIPPCHRFWNSTLADLNHFIPEGLFRSTGDCSRKFLYTVSQPRSEYYRHDGVRITLGASEMRIGSKEARNCRNAWRTSNLRDKTHEEFFRSRETKLGRCLRSLLISIDCLILRHDPYAPGMAEKYGMPGKTDNEGWHWRVCTLTSLVSCRPCFLLASNSRLICTADNL